MSSSNEAKHTTEPWEIVVVTSEALGEPSDGEAKVTRIKIAARNESTERPTTLFIVPIKNGLSIAKNLANTRRVVECVNALPELVHALRKAANAMGYKRMDDWGPTIELCKAALARVEGQKDG
jgi:hypothetical protein